MNILATIKREQHKLEDQVRKLQRHMDGLKAAAKALGSPATDRLGKARKRVLSAAGRARISAAAKRRWAKVRAGANKDAVRDGASHGVARRHKRVMSAAARARISAAQKRRWAKVRAGARNVAR